MKKLCSMLCLGVFAVAAATSSGSFDLNVKGISQLESAFSESLIQNSPAFNLQSAIQESLIDRESPEYILLS